ncbi:MAG: hypothetical protein PVG99_09365 [Desulfobacteraceae bacterium]|jgi:hypothetical protein
MERSAKTEHFRLWVFWTGIFNIVGYAALMCPFSLKIFMGASNGLGRALGLGGTALSMPENVNHVLMINILGLVVVFLGILLIIASLDIEKRAWFVFWEGLLRIFVFLFFLYYVLFSSAAQITLMFGVIDLIIGLIYMYYIFTIKDLKIA